MEPRITVRPSVQIFRLVYLRTTVRKKTMSGNSNGTRTYKLTAYCSSLHFIAIWQENNTVVILEKVFNEVGITTMSISVDNLIITNLVNIKTV